MSDAPKVAPKGAAAIANINQHPELLPEKDVLKSELLGEPLAKDAVKDFSREEVNQVIKAITDAFNTRYDALSDRIEKQALSIEKNRIVGDVKAAAVSGSIPSMHARTVAPISPQDKIAEDYRVKMKLPSNVRLRFVNNHSTLRPLRRAQGYEPALDERGAEVQHVDVVLMKIPQDRYKVEVADPQQAHREAVRGSLEQNFDDEVRAAGLEPIGKGIAYDDGSPGNPSKEE